MTVINTNIAALKAQYSMKQVNNALEKSMTQLSSGKRINSAADDAAGLSIANTMEAQLRGINMQIRNAQDGISLVQSVEGALEESTNILQRMNELATQASNSVFNAEDRAALQAEVSQLQSELDRIAQDTEFNGQKILDGSYSGKQLNVGFGANGLIAVDIGDHSASALSGAGVKDALAQLSETAANIAAGLNNQTAVSRTTQAAVSKADTQAINRSIAQINIGADNTQSVAVETVTKNIAAITSTHLAAVGTVAAATLTTVTTQAVAFSDTDKTYTVSGTNAAAGAGSIDVSIGGNTVSATTAGGETAAESAALIAAAINADATVSATVNAEVLDDGVTVQLSAVTSVREVADTAYGRDNRVAGVSAEAVGVVQSVADVAGSDGTAEVLAYRVDGKVEQGDVFSLSIDANTAVTYTVAQDDLAATESETKRNAIDSFVAKWNASSAALRTDVNAGEITLARVTNAAGDDYITMTAQYPRPTADAMTVTAFTLVDRATSSIASADLTAATTVAAASGVTATQELTLDTDDARVGDIFRINLDTLGNIDYTVTGTDIGATDAETLANIRQAIVDNFNSAEGYLTQSAAGGKVTAALSASDSSKIVLSGDDNTTGATFTAVVSAVAQTADATENVTAVTAATVLAGTHDNLIVSGSAPLAATRQLEITQQNASSGLADVGDVVTVDIEGHTFSHTVVSGDTYTTIAAGLVAAINGTSTGGSGEKLSLDGAGQITASNTAGVITLTAENKGVDSNFSVSMSTQNAAAVAEQQVYEVGVGTAYTEGQSARFSFGANNEIEVAITAEIAAMTAAEQAIAITSEILSRGSELQGVTLSAHATSTSKIVATSSAPGVALSFSTARSVGLEAEAQAQVSKLTISGYIGKNDVFTFTDGTTPVSVSVDDDVAQLDTNEERQAAVRDLLLAEMRADTTLAAAYTMTADGNSGILVEAKVAGTSFDLSSSTTSNMSASIARQAKIEDLTLSGDVEEGDAFSIDLGQGSAVTYVATAADASAGTAAERLTAARNGLLAAASAAFGETLDVAASGSDGIRLTAKQAGVDFRAVASVQNAADIAQVESVTFGNVEAGDVFTVAIGAESVSYTAAAGDTGSSIASWMAANGSFANKLLSTDANGALQVTGQAGESFAVTTSTDNFVGDKQVNTLTLSGTVETGDVYTVTLNGKDVSVAVSAAMSSISDVATAMVDAINSDADLNAALEATIGSNGGLTISSKLDGQAFTAQASVSDIGRSRDSVAEIDISTEAGANAAKSVIADALKQVNASRSVLGAIENRLNHTINNLGNVAVNTAASQSRIQDTDFAAATSELAKSQIMSQASTAMLAQANAAKQSVLSLLQ